MRILILLSACLLLSLPAFSANCKRIQKKMDRKCGKKPDSKKCKRLTDKYQKVCEEGLSGKEYRKGKKAARKASGKTGNIAKKCARIKKKMDRKCDKKPDGKRCARLTKKYDKKGCADLSEDE
ncbi:MAG: hypothetical protein HOE90_21165 [Bacteriovoracaceae bacterium]|jgi:hypothetical protein|nr:hypothetical protein [Bacteriovoracaceae bacterium]